MGHLPYAAEDLVQAVVPAADDLGLGLDLGHARGQALVLLGQGLDAAADLVEGGGPLDAAGPLGQVPAQDGRAGGHQQNVVGGAHEVGAQAFDLLGGARPDAPLDAAVEGLGQGVIGLQRQMRVHQRQRRGIGGKVLGPDARHGLEAEAPGRLDLVPGVLEAGVRRAQEDGHFIGGAGGR